MSTVIPDTVQRLVSQYISSVSELEVLLLVRRTRERTWSADDASRELRTSPELASVCLDQLVRKGFLKQTSGTYRYVAAGRLDAAVRDLDRAYDRYRTRIVRMIFD